MFPGVSTPLLLCRMDKSTYLELNDLQLNTRSQPQQRRLFPARNGKKGKKTQKKIKENSARKVASEKLHSHCNLSRSKEFADQDASFRWLSSMHSTARFQTVALRSGERLPYEKHADSREGRKQRSTDSYADTSASLGETEGAFFSTLFWIERKKSSGRKK